MEARSAPKVMRAEGWPPELATEDKAVKGNEEDEIEDGAWEEEYEEGENTTPWKDEFLSKFQRLRSTYRSSPPILGIPDNYLPLPPPDWNAWLHGTGGKETPDPAAVPFLGIQALASNVVKEPLPGVVASMDQGIIFDFLSNLKSTLSDRYDEYTSSISRASEPSTVFLPPRLRKSKGLSNSSNSSNATPNPKKKVKDVRLFPPLEARWILALLIAVEDVLTSDDICTLRETARLAIDVAKWRKKQGTAGWEEERAGCAIVVCAVAGTWGQSDLWDEAEEVFA
ncbi:hypothetical protein BT69DRAFT_1279883 [Atractiella rhizophila]|nr:hypothetical protein BT69DRAFT_1279883 [Atractiella rhizophila]